MFDRSRIVDGATNVNAVDSFHSPANIARQGPSGAPPCECYVTRDLLTEPPTTVCIVPDASVASSALARAGRGADTLYVTFADIEPTAGWLSDRNNATLDICFMHSFGKCFGKARERNACTCHQIHIKRDILDNLRRYYKKNQRHYFCRTIKANVSDRFAQVLSLLARRRFSIQYLEFKKENVGVTAGSTAYEISYRQWLLGNSPSNTTTNGTTGAAFTDNYISDFSLCWDYSLTGRCPKGATCPDIHGQTEKALTKDRHVRVALEELKRKEATLDLCQSGPISGLHHSQAVHYSLVPPPPPPQQPTVTPLSLPQGNSGFRMFSTTPLPPPANSGQCVSADPSQMAQLWQPGSLPAYYGAGGFCAGQPQQRPAPPYRSGNAVQVLAPPPPPSSAGPPQAFFPQGTQTNMPVFIISEGTDNVLRLVTINGFSSFPSEGAQLSR